MAKQAAIQMVPVNYCCNNLTKGWAQFVQRMDNIIHQINHYPVDKCQQNILDRPLDSG